MCGFLCNVAGGESLRYGNFVYGSSRKSGNEPVSCCRSIRSLYITNQLQFVIEIQKKIKKPGEEK